MPDIPFLSCFFPVQQTTSGIGHGVFKVVFSGLATNALNVGNSNNNLPTVQYSTVQYSTVQQEIMK